MDGYLIQNYSIVKIWSVNVKLHEPCIIFHDSHGQLHSNNTIPGDCKKDITLLEF